MTPDFQGTTCQGSRQAGVQVCFLCVVGLLRRRTPLDVPVAVVTGDLPTTVFALPMVVS